MGVTVIFRRNADGSPQADVTHEDGQAISVTEGHLYVKRYEDGRTWNTIAVYAPGSWQAAQRDVEDDDG